MARSDGPYLISSAVSGGITRRRPYLEDGDATQSWVAGNLVVIETDGQIKEWSAVGDIIVGVAEQDASGTGDTERMVSLIHPGDLWAMKCSDTLVAATHFGNDYDLVNSSSVHKVNLSATSNPSVYVHDSIRDEFGDPTEWAIVSFKSDKLMLGTGA